MSDNPFTVDEFLSIPEYSCSRLLTPGVDTSAAVIAHVSVNEYPAGAFIRNDEFVLTTAAGCRGSEALTRFFTELRERGASAVAITFLDGDLSSVPKAALAYASSAGMPVIWLPWEYRFADIVETVLNRIHRAETDATNDWELFRRDMLEAYLARASLTEAAKMIARRLDARVVIADAALSRALADSDGRLVEGESITAESLSGFLEYADISSLERRMGTVLVSAGSSGSVETDRLYAPYVSVPLALWFDRAELVESARTRRSDEILWRFLSRGFSGSESDVSSARFIGLDLTGEYVCLVCALSTASGDVRRYLASDAAALPAILPGLWPGGLAMMRDGRLTLLALRRSDAYAMAEALERRLGNEYPGLRFAWGISDPGAVSALPSIYRDALLASDVAVLSGPGEKRFIQRDTYVYRLLLTDDAERIARKLIAPLEEYSARRNVDLLSLLDSYLASGGNSSETARELHYHRQSLRYRLKKIEELTGCSLEDHEAVLALELSLRLRRYSRLSYGGKAGEETHTAD